MLRGGLELLAPGVSVLTERSEHGPAVYIRQTVRQLHTE